MKITTIAPPCSKSFNEQMEKAPHFHRCAEYLTLPPQMAARVSLRESPTLVEQS